MSPADRIIDTLRRTQAKRELAAKMGTLSKIQALQHWQCLRLLKTHDSLAVQQKYQRAMQFFIDELYGPKDFSQRDADLVRVVPKLAAILPSKAIQALDEAVQVNALSFDLDSELVEHLEGPIDAYQYANAYRKMGRLQDRENQIDIIYKLGEQLADVVHIRGVSVLIKLAKKPAELAGVLALHEFLEAGFLAFRKIGDIHEFIDPVLSKEREIMLKLLNTNCDLQLENPIPAVEATN